jgi:hypothetical protein
MFPASYGLTGPVLTYANLLRYKRYKPVRVVTIHTILNVASLSQFLTVREPDRSANLGPEFPRRFDHQIPWL